MILQATLWTFCLYHEQNTKPAGLTFAETRRPVHTDLLDSTPFTLLFGAMGTLFILMTIRRLFHLPYVRRLPSLIALTRSGAGPVLEGGCVSVIIAARDEAERIENTVRRLLTQNRS